MLTEQNKGLYYNNCLIQYEIVFLFLQSSALSQSVSVCLSSSLDMLLSHNRPCDILSSTVNFKLMAIVHNKYPTST